MRWGWGTRKQTSLQTEIGQLLDLITAPEDKVDLSKFSIEKCVPSLIPPHLRC